MRKVCTASPAVILRTYTPFAKWCISIPVTGFAVLYTSSPMILYIFTVALFTCVFQLIFSLSVTGLGYTPANATVTLVSAVGLVGFTFVAVWVKFLLPMALPEASTVICSSAMVSKLRASGKIVYVPAGRFAKE
ncbi:hypothetical protein D3C87_1672460 [compost metagenome]